MKKHLGFTLVELIIVVVILGLLAVVALPKFVNLTEKAKIAQLNGVKGSLKEAIGLVTYDWETNNREGYSLVDGTLVALDNGFGTAVDAGIRTFLEDPTSSISMAEDITDESCQRVFAGIMSTSRTISWNDAINLQTAQGIKTLKGYSYIAHAIDNNSTTGNDDTLPDNYKVISPVKDQLGKVRDTVTKQCMYIQVSDLVFPTKATWSANFNDDIDTGASMALLTNYILYDLTTKKVTAVFIKPSI